MTAKRDIRCPSDKIRVRSGRVPSCTDDVDDVGYKPAAAGSREVSTLTGGGGGAADGGGWRQSVVHSLFSPSVGNLSLVTLAACLLLPTMLVDVVLYPLFRLVFGTLYPAYASYKAVRGKDVKEYVKWMMYWIVFALFTSAETFTDVFLGFWFPFYYEVKVILVFWLLSPMTKGSSFLYRKFVHPMLSKREQDIDEYIARAKDQGYSTVLSLGTKGVNYATAVIMQTAIKNLGLPKSTSVPQLPVPERPSGSRRGAPLADEMDFQFSREEPTLSAFSDEEDVVVEKSVRKRITRPKRAVTTRKLRNADVADEEMAC